MLTLSISPSGQVECFCEALAPTDRGYYIDLPMNDPAAFQRAIYQALARRHAQAPSTAPKASMPSLTDITAWLSAHPVPSARKETLTLAHLDAL